MRYMWLVGEFFSLTKDFSFSHRTHRANRAFLRTVSIPQKASGIQISQSVTAIFNTNKGQRKAYILSIGVSRWSLPFALWEGKGEGVSILYACSPLLCNICGRDSQRLVMCVNCVGRESHVLFLFLWKTLTNYHGRILNRWGGYE